MEKRERGALSFRARRNAGLFLVGLLCLSMPAIAHAAEMEEGEEIGALLVEAVVEDGLVNIDAPTGGTEAADVVGPDNAASQLDVQPEGADAWRMVLPTPKTKTMAMLLQVSARAVFSRKDLPSAINMPMELSPSTPRGVADDVRYYFGSDGLAVAGRQKIGDCWYFFDDGCRMQTGWVTWKNGTKSFFDWDGRALTGWRSFNGVKYYFDPSTATSLRWSQKLGGSWYYFDSDSKMVKGWVTWKNGTKSFFDWDGRALTGWRSFNGVKYYFDPSTAMSLRWSQKLDGRWYYFDSASRMTRGIVTWKDGTKSYYDSQGRETGGWVQSDGAWYYFDWSDGKAVRWHQKIDGHWYYFDSDYQMHTGWLKWGAVQKWSYFYDNGQQAFGTQIIGGCRYVFDSNGETSTKPVTLPAGQLAMWNKAQNYYSNTNYIILVNSRTHKVGVFRGSSYNWEPVWYWDCTTGAPGSPTVKGTFTVGSRGKSFGSGYTCWYWTQFYGNYLFHSVLYQPGSMSRIQDGRLGISASHGCVRLDIECARWIYNNIPRGTRVVSY